MKNKGDKKACQAAGATSCLASVSRTGNFTVDRVRS